MSKTITGRQVVDLIETAAAIIIMDDNMAVTYPSVEQVGEDFWNIDINYDDTEEGKGYNRSFKIWEDDEIKVEGNQLFLLEDTEGETYGIKLLQIQNI